MIWLDRLIPVARLTVEALFNGFWQGFLVFVLAGLAVTIHRRASAATRYAIWWMTLVAIFAMTLIRPGPLPIGTVQRVSPATAISARPVATGVALRVPLALPRPILPEAQPAKPTIAMPRVSLPAPILPIARPIATVRVRSRGPLVLFALWSIGSLLMLSRLLWSSLHVARLRRQARPLEGRYQDRLQDLLACSTGGRVPRLCEVPRITTPMSIGPLDPLILVPLDFATRLTDAEIDQVLLHELAHVRRGDNWTNLFQRFAEALLFFHPAVWWTAKRLNLERESACDDWVVNVTREARPYAACLAKLAEVISHVRQPVLATGIFTGQRQISARIERLLDFRRNRRPRASRVAIAFTAAVLACAVVVCSQTRAVLAGPAVRTPLARLQAAALAAAGQADASEVEQRKRREADVLAVEDQIRKLDEQRKRREADVRAIENQIRELEETEENPQSPQTGDRIRELRRKLEALEAQRTEDPTSTLEDMLRSLRDSGRTEAQRRAEEMLLEAQRQSADAFEYSASDRTSRLEAQRRAEEKLLEALRQNADTFEYSGSDRASRLEAQRRAEEKLLEAQRQSADAFEHHGNDSASALYDQLRASQKAMESLQHSGEWTFEHSEGFWSGFSVRTKGTIEFLDDDSDVKSVSPDGYLTIEERNGWTTRKYEVTPTERKYSVNGRSQPVDNEARAWLADTLPQVIRDTGIGADARVKRILKQRGATGVLDEISKISSDRARRIYFESLFAAGPLPADALARSARQIARDITSDGEKARVLGSVADAYLKNGAARLEYFDAVNSIASDGEHRRVLTTILEKDGGNKDTLLLVLKSTARMSSDGDKARLLMAAADAPAFNDSTAAAFLDTVNTIESDGDHSRVLLALLRTGISRDTLLLTIRSAARISSDGDRARVLVRVADYYSGDLAVRTGMFNAIGGISSDGDHARVLLALLAKSNLDKDTYLEIVHSAAHMNSDGDKALVLRQVAGICPADDAIVDALVQAARTIASESDYRRVISAMLGRSDMNAKIAKIKHI